MNMNLSEKNKGSRRYQLRYAAGMYWLLDMAQSGADYKKPFGMNEVGAEIWKRLDAGESVEKIVAKLSEDSGVSQEEITKDVQQYQKQLIAYGILPDGGKN